MKKEQSAPRGEGFTDEEVARDASAAVMNATDRLEEHARRLLRLGEFDLGGRVQHCANELRNGWQAVVIGVAEKESLAFPFLAPGEAKAKKAKGVEFVTGADGGTRLRDAMGAQCVAGRKRHSFDEVTNNCVHCTSPNPRAPKLPGMG